MLSLLIVDDEILTREGIVNGLPWEELGIDSILQADDGASAMEVSSRCRPDIVLTDVRMPCMGGIEMSRNLRKRYPDCKIIFMSGYSDKEYLMSAIQLKAISYIEKPIVRDELKKVLMEAIDACREEEYRKLNDQIVQKKIDMSIPYVKNEIAIRLLGENEAGDLVRECLELGLLEVQPDSGFVTAIVRLVHGADMPDSRFYEMRRDLVMKLDSYFAGGNLQVISAFKDDEYLVVHIYCNKETMQRLKTNDLWDSFRELAGDMNSKRFFISIGKRVSGINHIRDSYNTAVLTMQKAFFHGYGSILYYSEDRSQPYVFNEDIIDSFTACLVEGSKHNAHYLILNLSSELVKHPNTIVNNIKNVFYRFMLALDKYAEKQGVLTFAGRTDKDYLWKTFSGFNTLSEVTAFSLEMVSDYFACVEELQQGKNNVIKIKKYIQNHYMNENLSVKDISSNTYLSTAYMCTYYKQETGKTIHQYITEYRVEKAKELLSDKVYRVSEIAGLVGYSDGNYFTKIFRKTTGISPTEFRERLNA